MIDSIITNISNNLDNLAILLPIVIALFTINFIIYFPSKIPSPLVNHSWFEPFFIIPSFFNNSIAQRLLKKRILKKIKIDYVPFPEQITFDKFIKNYKNLKIDEDIVTDLVLKQINNDKKIFIFTGDGGSGKSLTALKMIDVLKNQGYIPVAHNKKLDDKNKILDSSLYLDFHSAKILDKIYYEKYLFIFNDFEKEDFDELVTSLDNKYKESMFILTTRNNLESMFNFNNIDKKSLVFNMEINSDIDNVLSTPLYLSILKHYNIQQNNNSRLEVIKKCIDEEINLIRIRLKIEDNLKNDFSLLLNYILNSVAYLQKFNQKIKTANYFSLVENGLIEINQYADYEFLYKNMNLNKLKLSNELKNSSIINDDFKFTHDVFFDYFSKLASQQIIINIESFNDEKNKLIEAVSLDPNNKVANFKLAKLYKKNNDCENTLKYFYNSESIKVIEKIFQSKEVILDEKDFYNLGYLYEKKGQYEKALIKYDKAIKLYPDSNLANVYNRMGNTYHKQGQYTDAINSYQKAIELNPKLVVKYSKNLQQTYIEIGNYDEALQISETVISKHAKNDEFHFSTGYIYNLKNEYTNAMNLFNKINNKNSKYYDMSRIQIGHIYYIKNEYSKAIKYYKMAKNNDISYIYIGNAYFEQKKYTDAIIYYKKAIKYNLNCALCYGNLGAALLANKNYKEALENYKKAVEKNPKNGNSYHSVGYLLGIFHQHDEALTYYKKAIKYNKDNSMTYHNIAWTYRKKGKYLKAIAFSKKAISKNPKCYLCHLVLGNGYFKQGLYYKAVKSYIHSLSGNPKQVKYVINITLKEYKFSLMRFLNWDNINDYNSSENIKNKLS